jgi:hypothetical protein
MGASPEDQPALLAVPENVAPDYGGIVQIEDEVGAQAPCEVEGCAVHIDCIEVAAAVGGQRAS